MSSCFLLLLVNPSISTAPPSPVADWERESQEHLVNSSSPSFSTQWWFLPETYMHFIHHQANGSLDLPKFRSLFPLCSCCFQNWPVLLEIDCWLWSRSTYCRSTFWKEGFKIRFARRWLLQGAGAFKHATRPEAEKHQGSLGTNPAFPFLWGCGWSWIWPNVYKHLPTIRTYTLEYILWGKNDQPLV